MDIGSSSSSIATSGSRQTVVVVGAGTGAVFVVNGMDDCELCRCKIG
jgi:hypothetical protein